MNRSKKKISRELNRKLAPVSRLPPAASSPHPVAPEAATGYLQKLLQGENLPADPFERSTAARFVGVSGEIERVSRRLLELKKEFQQTQIRLDHLVGEAQGLGKLLAQAYLQRNVPAGAGDQPGMDLTELKKTLGADRVDAVDTRGEVLETTGKET